MNREPLLARKDYPVWSELTTRWGDNDAYGHVNNTVYYSWFDTVVNSWLIDAGLLDIVTGDPIETTWAVVPRRRVADVPPMIENHMIELAPLPVWARLSRAERCLQAKAMMDDIADETGRNSASDASG